VEIQCLQAAKVRREIRLRAGKFAEVGKFVRTEFVRLILLRPVWGLLEIGRIGPKIRAFRAPVAWADAVAPVVAIGKASARPANNRRLDALQIVDEFFPNASDVRNFSVLSDPDAIVNTAAQVFGEMSVNVGRNRSYWLIRENFDGRRCCKRGTRGEKRKPGKHELSSVHLDMIALTSKAWPANSSAGLSFVPTPPMPSKPARQRNPTVQAEVV